MSTPENTAEALAGLSLDSADGVPLVKRLGELLRPYGAAPVEEHWPEMLRSMLRQERALLEIRDLLAASAKPAPKSRSRSKGS